MRKGTDVGVKGTRRDRDWRGDRNNDDARTSTLTDLLSYLDSKDQRDIQVLVRRGFVGISSGF